MTSYTDSVEEPIKLRKMNTSALINIWKDQWEKFAMRKIHSWWNRGYVSAKTHISKDQTKVRAYNLSVLTLMN